MGLARALLGCDDFIGSRITSKEMVNWKIMAYEVLLQWIRISGEGNSLTLLNALKRTNREVAENFGQILTCGKNINHFAQFFILDVCCADIFVSPCHTYIRHFFIFVWLLHTRPFALLFRRNLLYQSTRPVFFSKLYLY